MAVQRRRWYKHLREITAAPSAFLDLHDYEEFHRQNRPGIFYRFALFLFCIVWTRKFTEQALQRQALESMTDYATELEVRLAHALGRITELENNAVAQRKARVRYDELRRARSSNTKVSVSVNV